MNIVADNALRIINEKGLRKKSVAQKAGLTARQLTDMLHGRRDILADSVMPLALALDVTPNDLFAEVESSYDGSEVQMNRFFPTAEAIPILASPQIGACTNLRPAGLYMVPSGRFAGTILPLYEMTDDPDKKFREKGTQDDSSL